MYTLIIAVILLAIGIWLNKKYSYSSSGLDVVGMLLILVSSTTILVFIIGLPMSRYEYQGKLRAYTAFKETVINARNNDISDIERAAILTEITKWNEWIVKSKYKNSISFFDPFVPDEINDLKTFQ
jgi:predicted membrane protein